MKKTLPEQLDATKAFRQEMVELRALHDLGDADRYEEFEARVLRAFKRGVHRAYLNTVLNFLAEKCGSQQAAAEELCLKDQSSISKKKVSGTIDGPSLTLAMYKYQDCLQMPSKDDAARYGYVTAITHIHDLELRCKPRTLEVAELDWILAALSSPAWVSAWNGNDLSTIRRETNHLLATESNSPEPPCDMSAASVEDLVEEWSDSLLLCLDVIPREGGAS